MINGNLFKKFKWGSLCFLSVPATLLFYNKIPPLIAIHFGFNGEADQFAPKLMVILLFPLASFLAHIGYMLILDKKPDWIGKAKPGKYSMLFFPITSNVVMYLMILNS